MIRVTARSLALALAAPAGASAQVFSPYNFAFLPSFAWPGLSPDPDTGEWKDSYARVSSGFQVSSSKHFGTTAGQTFGVEAGKMWRQEDLIIGIAGGLDYLVPFGNSGTPAFGRMAWTRDVAGALQVKVGTFVSPDVLVYAKAGLAAANEKLSFGPTAFGPGFSRSDIIVRPDARIGVEWSVTDKLTLGIEVGATGRAIR